MKEKDWFSRGIALSEPCNRTIVDNSLQNWKSSGKPEQLIS